MSDPLLWWQLFALVGFLTALGTYFYRTAYDQPTWPALAVWAAYGALFLSLAFLRGGL